jgi:hypothetical protein
MLVLVAVLDRTATAQYTLPPDANASFTTIWNTTTGDWATAANWTAGFGGNGGVPDANSAMGQDFGLINNGGTATVNTAVAAQAGGVILGELAANSGTLDVQSGGSLDVIDHPTFTSDGSVQVGRGGTGNLFVRRNGTLNAASVSVGGVVGSTMTLGGATGTGNASVTLSGDATLARTTRVIGPNVDFNSTNITMQGTSVFIPELTAATHSALKSSGTATLAGALQVDLNGAPTPTGSTWTLIDAATINGNFASITGDAASPLGLGQGFRFQVVNGGNGQLGQLAIVQQLVLNVNRSTGAVSITNPNNPGGVGTAIDGYTIQSSAGSINAGAWQSLQDNPGVAGAGWEEANPNANRVSELRSGGTSTLALGNSWGLGSLFQPPTPTAFGVSTEDLVFQYNDSASQSTVTGTVNYTGSGSINNLVLFVNPTTGQVHMRNTSPFTVKLDGYTISSAGNSLNSNPASWSSLQDQLGSTWAEANLSDGRVSELKSGGTTTLLPNGGTTFDLGNLFNTVDPKDLVFQFVLEEGGVPGDYNNNGIVDAADYTIWRDHLNQSFQLQNEVEGTTPGMVTAEDYDVWKANFGNDTPIVGGATRTGVVLYESLPAGSGSLAVAGGAVPEPATWVLTAFVSCVASLARRRRA